MRERAFGLAVGLSVAIAMSQVSPAAVLADTRKDLLDAWLAAHPTVAGMLIWEFPPTKLIHIPNKPFIVWAAPLVTKDPLSAGGRIL